MFAAPQSTIGAVTERHHSDRGAYRRERRQQAGLEIRDSEVLDDRRQEEADAVAGGILREIDNRPRQNPRIADRLQETQIAMVGRLQMSLLIEPPLQPGSFILLQPTGKRRTVGQIEQDPKSHEDRRYGLQYEKP